MKEEPKFAPNNHLYLRTHSASKISMDLSPIESSLLFYPQKDSVLDMILKINSWLLAATMV